MQIGYYLRSSIDESFELDPRFGTIMATQLKLSDYGQDFEILRVSEPNVENCDYSVWPNDEKAEGFFSSKLIKCLDKEFFVSGKPISEENNHIRLQF